MHLCWVEIALVIYAGQILDYWRRLIRAWRAR